MDLVNKEQLKESIKAKLMHHFGKTLEDSNAQQVYQAAASTLRDSIMEKWEQSRQESLHGGRKLYYLSVEFLLGRLFASNLLNMGVEQVYRDALDELGYPLDKLEGEEAEPGLGNGGLGRLAACFLDSLSTMGLPAMGCTIRYEYGLFRQTIVGGEQKEIPDQWLKDGCAWEVERPEEAIEVHFGGTVNEVWEKGGLHINHTGYTTVVAIPYDLPIVGYDNQTVNTLRMWSARAPQRLNMDAFNRGQYMKALEERELSEVISKILYPADSHIEGKALRLKQHYFFTAATVGHIIREYKASGRPLSELPEHVCIQINDTHPGLAIPEMMRILLDEEHMPWEDAWDTVSRCFNYTNHTVMSEALERWPSTLVEELLPRIFRILEAINQHFCQRLWSFFPGQWEKIGAMSIIGYGEVRMANLCIAASSHVNGVSQLHADILKQELFKEYYLIEPWKFLGITNGVTHRRWLMLDNPGLSALITDAIGDAWIKQPERLSELLPYTKDSAFLNRLDCVKRDNKLRFCDYIKRTQGVQLNPDSIFDVQAKRLHEYKRQLLNVLHIIYLYDRILSEPDFTMQPQTFLFAAKAYPNYAVAKQIIKLIHKVADMVDRTPKVNKFIKVVFVENYSVGVAQVLIPAAELSEQLSTAGKEASGTGNMKFMMNGALTIGTMDGANVEIYEQVGEQNMFLFGNTAEQNAQLYASGTYSAGRLYETDNLLRKLMDYLINGRIVAQDPSMFRDIYHLLLFGNGGIADPYLVLPDMHSYIEAQERVRAQYMKSEEWNAKALINIAHSGFFSSDRTVAEYNRLIWRL